VIGGASYGEIGFAALLVLVVVAAPVVPKIGEILGGLFAKRGG
jgi:hypothetical protein